ncbi:MAG: integration host factor subunit alpha [Myxococcales bacterium]|nr:integration host factor subunit alpha [Myxococcales bacterium]
MTKAEIVQALYTRVGGFSKKESADIVDMVFEMMKETLGRGEKIKISGFGNFVLRDKRQRPGRNPQTGDPIKISERRVLTFKASQILKQALNPRTGNGADDLIEDEPDEDDDDNDSSDAAAAATTVSVASTTGSSPMAAPTPVTAAAVSNEAPKE